MVLKQLLFETGIEVVCIVITLLMQVHYDDAVTKISVIVALKKS